MADKFLSADEIAKISSGISGNWGGFYSGLGVTGTEATGPKPLVWADDVRKGWGAVTRSVTAPTPAPSAPVAAQANGLLEWAAGLFRSDGAPPDNEGRGSFGQPLWGGEADPIAGPEGVASGWFTWIESAVGRLAIIILGFVFVAAGLALFRAE